MMNNLPMNVPSGPYVVELEQYEEASSFPSIAIEEIGMPGLGANAFDSFLGTYIDDNGDTQEFYGKQAQTMVEFNLQSNLNQSSEARQQIYQMYDQLEFMCRYSGEYDHSGNLILPVIQLLDMDANPPIVTHSTIWVPMEKDSIWFPTYIGTDPQRPGIKRMSVRTRVFWHMQEIPGNLVMTKTGMLLVNNNQNFITTP